MNAKKYKTKVYPTSELVNKKNYSLFDLGTKKVVEKYSTSDYEITK